MVVDRQKMVRLIIDEREVSVPQGTNLLEAAKTVGIVIPHFCYHRALGAVGACRLCAVKLVDGPVKGLRMSCMIDAADGMVVSTNDPEALKMRKLVIEWLMTNHPHDCPVCDEGGECLLQDMTIAGGHSIRRYRGKKRTYLDQELGPYIHHEMNRCIQCYRCSRFYQEFAGGTDFGPLGISNRVYFGRFKNGAFESPFSGNIVDICPTGTFTDKTARYQARWWDYEMAPSVCPVCSLGCNTLPAARYRELLKIQGRFNEEVNGHFICDQGRFSQSIVNGPQRIRSSSSNGNHVSLDRAMEILVRHLSDAIESGCGDTVGLLCSGRASLETQISMRTLAERLKTPWAVYFSDRVEEERTRCAVSHLNARTVVSMREIENADFIVIIGADLQKEAPMMALAVRQASRKGARIIVIHSFRPMLPFLFEFTEAPEDRWKKDLKSVFGQVSGNPGAGEAHVDAKIRNPVMICGTEGCSVETIRSVADFAEEMQQRSLEAKISYILRGPNSFGAALLSGEERWETFFHAIQSGKIRWLLAIEADLPAHGVVPEALKNLDFLAIADHVQPSALFTPHLIVPTTTYAEMSGTYINQEGRAQRFLEVMNPGLRIRHLDPALHPPREFRRIAPAGDILPAEAILKRLLEALGGESGPRQEALEFPKDINPDGPGMRVVK